MKTIKTCYAEYDGKTTQSFNSVNELYIYLKKNKINNYRIKSEEMRTVRDLQGNL